MGQRQDDEKMQKILAWIREQHASPRKSELAKAKIAHSGLAYSLITEAVERGLLVVEKEVRGPGRPSEFLYLTDKGRSFSYDGFIEDEIDKDDESEEEWLKRQKSWEGEEFLLVEMQPWIMTTTFEHSKAIEYFAVEIAKFLIANYDEQKGQPYSEVLKHAPDNWYTMPKDRFFQIAQYATCNGIFRWYTENNRIMIAQDFWCYKNFATFNYDRKMFAEYVKPHMPAWRW